MNLPQLYQSSKKYIDYKLGTAGAIFMGGLVGAINSTHGVLSSLTAASKQAAYTFFIGGFVMKSCENIAKAIRAPVLAITLETAIPSTATITATYGLHKLKGTPKPIESTIPTAILAPTACLAWASIKRKKRLEENVEEGK